MALAQAKIGLQKLLFKIVGEEKKDFVLINLGWKRIVGKIMADRSFVLSQRENVLFVGVVNNVWMQELILQRDFLIRELNKIPLKIKIEQIIFTIKMRKNKWN